MPRYIVERRLADTLKARADDDGAAVASVSSRKADLGVNCVHSYISNDRQSTFWVCDGPDPESIREAWWRMGFPCDEITEVGALDPYFDQ